MTYPRVSLYALMLAAAGIPLYIHLPRFASVNLGLGLGAVGAILLAIRLIDLVQDPADRLGHRPLAARAKRLCRDRRAWPCNRLPPALHPYTRPECHDRSCPDLDPAVFGLQLGMILLYGRSATLADSPTPRALMTLAAYREVGMLGGVIVAAMAPALLAAMGARAQGYPSFGVFLGALAIATALLTLPIWRRTPLPGDRLSFRVLVRRAR